MTAEMILCPKCKRNAFVVERAALVGMPPKQIRRNVYGCQDCQVPEYSLGNDSIYYRQFTFLSDGEEVI